MFDRSLKLHDMWYNTNEMIYPKHQKNYITLYHEELEIARSNALHWFVDGFEVSMFYPLI